MRPEIIQTMVEGGTYVITLNKKLLFSSGGHQYFYTGELQNFILSKEGTVVGIHIGDALLSTDSIDCILERSL